MQECLVSGTRGWVPLPCLQVLGYHERLYAGGIVSKEKARKVLYLSSGHTNGTSQYSASGPQHHQGVTP